MTKQDGFWHSGKEQHAFKIIRRQVKAKVVEDEGLPFTLRNIVGQRSLAAWINRSDADEGVVLSALIAMKAKGHSSCEAFEVAYLEAIRKLKSQSHLQLRWSFFLPLRLIFDVGVDLPLRVSVQGKVFTFTSWNSALRKLGKKKHDHNAKIRLASLKANEATCLRVACDGINYASAWHAIDPAFDTLRGALQIACDFGRIRYEFGKSTPLGRIPCPSWAIAVAPNERTEHIGFLVEAHEQHGEPIVIKEHSFGFFRTFLRAIGSSSSEGSTRLLIADALRLYAQAMNYSHKWASLVGFWQMAESLTLSKNFEGRTKYVCSRLVHLQDWYEVPEALHDVLKAIADKRNEIVHRGLQGACDDGDVNIMKICCETALVWLVQHIREFPSLQHLEFFYQQSQRRLNERRILKNVLASIERKV